MPEPLSFFDETVLVGRRLMGSVRGMGDTDLADSYLTKLAEIFALLAETHETIARAALNASVDPVRAGEHLKALEPQNLEGTFRLNKWCDEFQRLGMRLRDLGGLAGLPPGDNDVWVDLCRRLEKRESEVAILYHESLGAILEIPRQAASGADAARQLDEVANRLVVQKAQFDFLAKQALALRRTLV